MVFFKVKIIVSMSGMEIVDAELLDQQKISPIGPA